MHENVLLTGRLQGMDHQAACELMAKRSRGAGKFVYGDPVIIHVPVDLPEGEYTLHFEDVSIPVLHKGVLWIVLSPAPGDEAGRPGSPSKRGWGPVALARRMLSDRRKKK